MPISFYLFIDQNSRLSLSEPFSLSQSILRISTYICFFLFSIHLYFFIPIYQSILMSISFDLFSVQIHGYIILSQSILCISTYIFSFSCLSTSISLYLFINPDWCLLLSISLSIHVHAYLFQSLSLLVVTYCIINYI